MFLFISVAIAAIVIFFVYRRLNQCQGKNEVKEDISLDQLNTLPYAKKNLLSRYEYIFYSNLEEKCEPESLIICPKVRLEDILTVTDKENSFKWRNYIKSRHIDFLICDKNMNVLAGIELDDRSHKTEKAQNSDRFKNNIFIQIKTPLYRINSEKGSFENQIDNIIKELKTTI